MRQGVELKMGRFLQDGERTVEQMISRVSSAIGADERDCAALSREMTAARFLPAGRTLKFAGAGSIPPNCAVLPMNRDDDGTLARDASRMMRLSARTNRRRYRPWKHSGQGLPGEPALGIGFSRPGRLAAILVDDDGHGIPLASLAWPHGDTAGGPPGDRGFCAAEARLSHCHEL